MESIPMSIDEGLELLNLLGRPIYNVDGGCSHCRGEFIEEANGIFEKEGLPYRFRDVQGEWYTVIVEAYCVTDETVNP